MQNRIKKQEKNPEELKLQKEALIELTKEALASIYTGNPIEQSRTKVCINPTATTP